jgi:hypothetical protein
MSSDRPASTPYLGVAELTPHGDEAGESWQGVRTMATLEPDPNLFGIFGPVWQIVDRDSIENPSDRGSGGTEIAFADGSHYVPFFTDEDLARRFADQTNKAQGTVNEVVVALIPARQNWLTILEYLAERGYEYVTIDPDPPNRIELKPIRHLMRVIRENPARDE